MKEFLRDFLIEPFKEKDYFIGIISWLLTLLIVFLILGGGLYFIDSSFLSTKEKKGIIVNKYISPAHTTTTYIYSGKVLVPITHYYNISYHLQVNIDDLSDDVSVYEETYNQEQIGEKLICKYKNGRIFNSLYIEDIK